MIQTEIKCKWMNLTVQLKEFKKMLMLCMVVMLQLVTEVTKPSVLDWQKWIVFEENYDRVSRALLPKNTAPIFQNLYNLEIFVCLFTKDSISLLTFQSNL